VVEQFLLDVTAWAAKRADVSAVALVGSHARGEATEDSDVDLVVLCDSPSSLLCDPFPSLFGVVSKESIEDWGRLTSRRVFFDNGLEVEFGIALRGWALEPDEGTIAVVERGCIVLHDPQKLLATLLSRL
jgi:predicted nucleotidyltransferase